MNPLSEGGGFKVTAAHLTPIFDTISSNAMVIVPWGLGIVGLMVGINMIPKLIKRFAKG